MARWFPVALVGLTLFVAGCTSPGGQDRNGPFAGTGVDYDAVADRLAEDAEGPADPAGPRGAEGTGDEHEPGSDRALQTD